MRPQQPPPGSGKGRPQGSSGWAFYCGQFFGLGIVFLWLLVVLNVALQPPRQPAVGAMAAGRGGAVGSAGVAPLSAGVAGGAAREAADALRFHPVVKSKGSLPVVNLGLPPLSISSKPNQLPPIVLRREQKAGSVGSRQEHELQWPPLRLDGSIDPADGYDTMPLTGLAVPRFWGPSPGEAVTRIGSHVNGKETIFLMIASYRDFQCRETIAKAYLRADDPSRLFIGAVDQVVAGDTGCLSLEVPCERDPEQPACKYRDQISVYEMDATVATGPVTARHIGDRLYRGQYFVMQMDAHCHFASRWDTSLIRQWRETGNEMAVLSSYLTDIKGSLDANFASTRNTRPIMCNSDFEGAMPARYLRHGSQPEDFPPIRNMPQLQPFWAAGFSFSRGHFTVTVPYDGYEPMVFQVYAFLSYWRCTITIVFLVLYLYY
jgi:hypothetical protein